MTSGVVEDGTSSVDGTSSIASPAEPMEFMEKNSCFGVFLGHRRWKCAHKIWMVICLFHFSRDHSYIPEAHWEHLEQNKGYRIQTDNHWDILGHNTSNWIWKAEVKHCFIVLFGEFWESKSGNRRERFRVSANSFSKVRSNNPNKKIYWLVKKRFPSSRIVKTCNMYVYVYIYIHWIA